MAVDGYLRIKTKLDNSDVDKGVQELENKIKKLQTENMDLSSQQDSLQQELNNYDKLYQKADAYKNKIKELETAKLTMRQQNPTVVTSNNAEYANLSAQLTAIKQKYAEATAELDKQYPKIDKITTKLEKVKAKQTENNTKIAEYKEKIDNIDLEKINTSLAKTNINTDSLIKKVGKWALAVFGVRSAYSAIRTAMSTLTQYNKQLSSDISYIQYALAKVLEPVILRLVNLVYKVLAYVNYLAKAWFNVDLFANSSASSFVSASNSLSSAAESAKELSKATQQGFDEMNVMQETDTSSTDSSSSVYAPSFDLSGVEDIEIPDWLVKFKEFCQPIIDFFNEIIEKYGPVAGGIAIVVGALVGFSILKSIIKWITGLGSAVSGVSVDFTGFFNSLGKAAEAIAILGGLALVIEAITDLIDTFSESGLTLGEVAGLLGTVLGEVAATFLVLAAAMKYLSPSWESIAGAIVIFAGLAIVLVTVTDLIDTFSKSGMTLGDVIGLMVTILASVVALMAAVALLGPMMTAGLLPFIVVIAAISVLLIVIAETLPVILEACSDFIVTIAPAIVDMIRAISDGINSMIKTLGEVLPPIIESVGSVFNTIFTGIAKIVTSVGDTVSKIVDTMGKAMSGTLEGIRKIIKQVGDTVTQVATTIIWFINQLGPAINNFVDNAIKAVTKLINFVISGIEYLINTLLIPAYNKIASTLSELPLINIKSASKISIARFSPKLATGGIVDLPGRGVDIGGAIAGEAGREGVLPLTNQATMAELGQEIGKWIKVNNTVNNYMNGRLIQRQMSKQQQELAYATNGRM